jgi:hypothetical protein
MGLKAVNFREPSVQFNQKAKENIGDMRDLLEEVFAPKTQGDDAVNGNGIGWVATPWHGQPFATNHLWRRGEVKHRFFSRSGDPSHFHSATFENIKGFSLITFTKQQLTWLTTDNVCASKQSTSLIQIKTLKQRQIGQARYEGFIGLNVFHHREAPEDEFKFERCLYYPKVDIYKSHPRRLAHFQLPGQRSCPTPCPQAKKFEVIIREDLCFPNQPRGCSLFQERPFSHLFF